MKINVLENSKLLGKDAAVLAAQLLNEAIEEQGYARLLLSTGSSQFDTVEALKQENVDWSKVEMFHLDEYVGLPVAHIASFRKYLKERFVDFVNLKAVHYVNGEGDVEENIKKLTDEIRKSPIDVALIGIGENGHIAFNDPPADFETKAAYKIVHLDDRCKMQQVGEGWFATLDDVPKTAISMTVHQILESKVIISCVPHAVKAEAIANTFKYKLNNMYPSTALKYHKNWHLYLDENSASLLLNK